MEQVNVPFAFKQCVSVLKSTGRKATNLRELRDGIELVSGKSVFHHTYQYYLKEHILEYTNDFAHWAGESLEERALAERLSNIDPYESIGVEDLRVKLIEVIDQYLAAFPEPRQAIPGDEFFFNETLTLVFPAGIAVKNLAEFLMAVKYVESGSLYFHFYEARMRTGRGDDFSRWFEDVLGETDLARRVRSIDLFMHGIGRIREHIASLVEQKVKRDMEGIYA